MYENNISGARKRLCRTSENGKQSKDRISLALAASMMGGKRKPLVIGKAQKQRCFAYNLCFIVKQIKQ